jgi:hypothetical protein
MIDDAQKKILAVVLDRGQIRGFELKQVSGLEDTQLADAVRPLISLGLITASGTINPETIDRVQFAPLSSAFEKSYLLQQ